MAAASADPQILEIRPAGYGKTTLVRAPAHDSASIESHRLGGNFAYSTAEAHAFARTTEELSTAIHPVAETINTHVPAPIAKVQPAPIEVTNYAAKPIIGQQPIIAHKPVIGQVGQYTKVTQPVFKSRTLVQTSPAQVAVAPVVAPVAAKVAPVAVAPALAYNGYAAGAPLAYAGAYNGAYAAGAYAAAPLGYANAAPIAAAAAPVAATY